MYSTGQTGNHFLNWKKAGNHYFI